MNTIFQRKEFFENLLFSMDGTRVILTDEQTGTIAFQGTQWLFAQCLKKGWIEEINLSEEVELSLFPRDRDPKWRAVTIKAQRKIANLMEDILDNVSMTKDNYQRLANILAKAVE